MPLCLKVSSPSLQLFIVAHDDIDGSFCQILGNIRLDLLNIALIHVKRSDGRQGPANCPLGWAADIGPFVNICNEGLDA